MSLIDLTPFNSILDRLEGLARQIEQAAAAGNICTPSAPAAAGRPPAATGPGPAAPAPAGGRPSTATGSGSTAPVPGARRPSDAEIPAIVRAFDAFIGDRLPALESAAREVGAGEVVASTDMLVKAFRLLRDVLLGSGSCRKPKDSDWARILGPVMELGTQAQKACDNRSEFFQNRKAVAEALNAVTFLAAPSPPTHVQNALESADFHATKVMQKRKEAETGWAKALKSFLKDLKDWCTENCKLGITWTATGQDPLAYFAEKPLGCAAVGPNALRTPMPPTKVPAARRPSDAEMPAIVRAFDAFIGERLPALESAAREVGAGDVVASTDMLVKAFRLLRDLLLGSGSCRRPKDSDWARILGPVMELGTQAQKACDNRSEFFQNRKAVAEALNAVTFLAAPSPPTHVQNALESTDFHATKVMQKRKEAETGWAKALKSLLKDLKDWCTENCKLGITWTATGQDPLAYFAEKPLGSAAVGPNALRTPMPPTKGKGKGPAMPKGGLPPPPPVPPPEVAAKLLRDAARAPGGSAAPAAAGMSAVFNQIGQFNVGNLNKVTPEMKTKNQPKDGKAAPLIARKVESAPAKARPSGKGPKGPPLKELQRDFNWILENFDGVPDLTLDSVQMNQLVCLVNCRNSTLRLSSKVKSICIDSCINTNVICADVISAVELVNSDRCKVQTTGKVNSFAIDKCDGVNIFLSKDSLHAELVTSKSSDMNVTVPEENGGEGDVVELPIPEQFVTRVVGPRKLRTEVSSLYSS